MAKRRNRAARAAETPAAAPAAGRASSRALVVLVLASLGAKAAVLAQLGGHPLLQPAGDIDGGVYARLAGRIAGGDLLLKGEGPVPYFVSPLYAYFLAACGASWPVARVVQILLGAAAVALVFLAARRLFGERAAFVAGVLYALAGVVTFHEVVILQAALDPFLTALFLYLLAVGLTSVGISSKVNTPDAATREEALRAAGGLTPGSISSKVWVAAGAAGGLLALNRPNALVAVFVVAIALAVTAASLGTLRPAGSPFFTFRGISLRTFLPALSLLAGAGLAIAPFTLRNLAVSHEFVLISSHGGLNFRIGNGPEVIGTYRALPGITPDIGGQARDAKRVAEAAEGRPLTTHEVSAHFAREAWDWIRRSPGAAAFLFLRKTWYLLSGDEVSLNFSVPWYRDRSPALKLLAVGPGLLVPLAGAGLVLGFLGFARVPRRELLVWAAFVPAYVVSVAAFFVATRYRLSLLVALAPLAGNAVAALPAAWRAGRLRAVGAAGLAAAALAAVSLWPTGLYDGGADEDLQWALYLVEKGDAAEAARVARAAAAAHPEPGVVWFRMGQAFGAARRMDDAIEAFERAAAEKPHPPATERALAAAHESRGVDRLLAHDTPGALPDLERAAALQPEEPGMLVNLAAALADTGERARARDLARRALELRPGYEKAEALLRALR